MDNLVKTHNEVKHKTWKLELNSLSDMSQEDMDNWNRAKHPVPTTNLTNTTRLKRRTLLSRPVPTVTWLVPDSVNWTAKGIVPTVLDQGECGSCYSFAAAGAIEAKYQIETGRLVQLSEENIIDCSSSGSKYGNDWCDGGEDINVFKFVADNGLHSLAAYPYTSKDYPAVASLGYQWILNPWSTQAYDGYNVLGLNNAGDADLLKSFVAKQPVSVSMYASMPDFHSYKTVIYASENCPKSYTTNNHAVLIVGYGTDSQTGMDYWIVKNSWGGWPVCTTQKTCSKYACRIYTRCTGFWGQGGYFQIQRGVNMCGIENFAAIPK